MMKRIVLSLLMVIVSIVPCFADVTYDGSAKDFVFTPGSEASPTDLFNDQFKDMMPGDVVSQEIGIKNDSDRAVKIYMRSDGAQEGTDEFLSKLTLDIKYQDPLYEGPANEQGDLRDWVCLGTFKPRFNGVLNVRLTVPKELGDEYANQVGYIDWRFKVEELGKDIDGDGDVQETGKTNPGTGDDVTSLAWGTFIASGLVLILAWRSKKHEK